MAASSVDKLQHFVNQPAHYQQRWARHDTAFWLKFVVREWTPLLSLHARDTNTHLDYIYVNLLKLVLGKKFGKLHKYVSAVLQLLQADGELSSQDGKLLEGLFGANCKEAAPWWLNFCLALHVEACEALLELLDAEKDLFLLLAPEVWSQPAEHARPFEAFLRSRWGEELPDLLTVPKSELSWWTKPMAASKPPARDCPAPRGYWVHPRGPEGVETWLQRYQPPMTQGTYKKGPPLEGRKKLLWQVLELSIPPVWSRKFHLCDSWQLTKGLTNFEALNSCSWIATWLQAFDLDYMHVLKKKCKEQVIAEYSKTIKSIQALPSAPRDLETQADFLLEPTLLLQLPCSAALFQQWLAGALLEVTRFEALSMELRHWPMDQDVLIMSTKLLGLVARCKERLVLGLALLSRDITAFPHIISDVPCIILNQVVMPAVSVLRFLLHGQAYSILHQLKHRAFSQNSDLKTFPKSEHRCVHPDAYNLEDSLRCFYVSHYFHVFYWMRDAPPQPFSNLHSGLIDKLTQVFRKRSFPAPLWHTPIFYEPVSNEEFRKACQNNETDIFGSICSTSLTARTDVEGMMKRMEQYTKDMEISPSNREEAQVHRATMLRHSSLFTEVGEFARRVRAEPPSLLGCLVASTAEALVREHEVRCDLLDALIRDKPVHVPPSAGQDPPCDLEQIHAALDQATKEFVSARGEHLQTLFPAQWLEKHTVDSFCNQLNEDFKAYNTSKKLICQFLDKYWGMVTVLNFSVLHDLFNPNLTRVQPILENMYLDFSLPLLFCVPTLCNFENCGSIDRVMATAYMLRSLQSQFRIVSHLQRRQNPYGFKEISSGSCSKESEAIVRTFALRQETSTNRLLVFARKCGVSVDSYLQSRREWLSCVAQVTNEAQTLLCFAADRTFYFSWIVLEQHVCRLVLGVPDNLSECENELQRLMVIHAIIDALVQVIAAIGEMDFHIKNQIYTKLLFRIQPALLKVNTALVSCCIAHHTLPTKFGKVLFIPSKPMPDSSSKFLSQLRSFYSIILQVILAIRQAIPCQMRTPLRSLKHDTEESHAGVGNLFLHSSKECESIFEKLGLPRSTLEEAEQYLGKLPSHVKAKKGEEVFNLDPEGFFEVLEKRQCVFCKKFKQSGLRACFGEEEEKFFCNTECARIWLQFGTSASSGLEERVEERRCEQCDAVETAQTKFYAEKLCTYKCWLECKARQEEKVEKRRCQQCQKEETAGSKFHTEKFCSKKCQNDWKTAHECYCCKEEVTPEVRRGGAVVLCSARCQVKWIQEQQGDRKKKRCGLCRRSREGSEGFLPCGGRVFCGAPCRDGWRANGGRPYESGLLDCSYCGKREKKDEQFSLCPACVSDPQFPRPEVYCSQECRQIWWDQEHQPQHLEFELGLGDFFTPQ